MATVTITISLKSGTTDLILTNPDGHAGPPEGFISKVNRGDTVVWRLSPNSGIGAIIGIRAKDGRFNVFNNSDPKSRTDGTWSGKIKDDAAGTDSYDIDYVINGKNYTADPDIKVEPPTP